VKALLLSLSVAVTAGGAFALAATPPGAAERGREAVHRPLNAPTLSPVAYENAWKRWGQKEKPADFERRFRERYGLHPAPYDNQGLPMGFHHARGLVGAGIGNDCLVCHAGRVAGQTYIGLGNASLDLQGLFDELVSRDGPVKLPYRLSNVRGTLEASAVIVYLMQFRDDELNLRFPRKLACRDDLCQKIPAWWHLRKKKTMYHTGAGHAASVRTLMPFLLSPLNSGAFIKKQEPVFADIQAYLRTLEPPRYPFPVDRQLAARGEGIFRETCSRCHGTYGPGGRYPSKVVPLDVIGTDRALAEGVSPAAAEAYLKSWFAQEKGPDGKPYPRQTVRGYQAPPLDGVWATAPYLHNGSVPTVYHLLNSKARPRIFTRSYRTGKEDYDPVRLGWKFTALDEPADPGLPALERRKVYDTTQPGRGNGGHTFGDQLTEEERRAVIEYLKTL
jgi:mono/diheme cytochrome c family protein